MASSVCLHGVSHAMEPKRAIFLCLQVENHVVGAPCGVMDQARFRQTLCRWLMHKLCRVSAAANSCSQI